MYNHPPEIRLQVNAFLQQLGDQFLQGDIGGIAVFYTAPDGYNCFISPYVGDLFGLTGYIHAASSHHLNKYIVDNRKPTMQDIQEELPEEDEDEDTNEPV